MNWEDWNKWYENSSLKIIEQTVSVLMGETKPPEEHVETASIQSNNLTASEKSVKDSIYHIMSVNEIFQKTLRLIRISIRYASKLTGVKEGTIYYWISQGYIEIEHDKNSRTSLLGYESLYKIIFMNFLRRKYGLRPKVASNYIGDLQKGGLISMHESMQKITINFLRPDDKFAFPMLVRTLLLPFQFSNIPFYLLGTGAFFSGNSCFINVADMRKVKEGIQREENYLKNEDLLKDMHENVDKK